MTLFLMNMVRKLFLFSGCAILIFVFAFLLKRRAINALLILSVLEFALSGGIHYIRKMDTSERGSYAFANEVTMYCKMKIKD